MQTDNVVLELSYIKDAMETLSRLLEDNCDNRMESYGEPFILHVLAERLGVAIGKGEENTCTLECPLNSVNEREVKHAA